MSPLVLLATVTLHWTNPSFMEDTTHSPDGSAVNPCGAGSNPVHLIQTNIYRAWVGSIDPPVYLRSHAAVEGTADTIQVPDDPPASYFVGPENAAGEGCRTGYTVGVPSVSVPPWWPLEKDGQAFDIQGRRIEPGASGVYFTRHRKRIILK